MNNQSIQKGFEPKQSIRELTAEEILSVGGGQRGQYCVYGPNGSVGVHDWDAMVSRPASSGECSLGNW